MLISAGVQDPAEMAVKLLGGYEQVATFNFVEGADMRVSVLTSLHEDGSIWIHYRLILNDTILFISKFFEELMDK